MPLGLELSESMSGSWYRLDDPCSDRAIRTNLLLGVGTSGLRRLLGDRRIEVHGTAFLEGLAEGEDGRGRPAFGHLSFRLLDQKRIPYDLELQGDDGKHYRIRGQRDFFLHDVFDSLTLLPATLYDESGAEMGRAKLRFDPRSELLATIKSVRPRLFR